MAHHAATLDNLLPATRVCRTCRKPFTESYFSMTLAEGDARFQSSNAEKVKCNTCRTRQPGGTGYFEGELDWHAEAICSNPLVPADSFFPETAEEIAREAWRGFCGHCPVQELCLNFGEKTKGWGVYGNRHLMDGLSVNEYADKISAAKDAVRMFKNGETIAAISKQTGFSRNTVTKWLNKAGVRVEGANHRTRSPEGTL